MQLVMKDMSNDILVLTTGESGGCEEGGNSKNRSSQQSKANHGRQSELLMIQKKNGEKIKKSG